MKRLPALLLVAVFLYPTTAYSVTQYKTSNYAKYGVSLTLDDAIGSIYQEGEEVGFSIRTDTEATVIIFNIDTDGFVHLLYPRDGKNLRRFSPGRVYYLPEDPDQSLVVGGTTGIEFVFALAVENRDDINEEELRFLVDGEELPEERKFRIDGDPLLAANRVASQIVRGISHRRGVTLSFTYFYINDAVDFPRYLCEDCYENGKNPYAEGMPRYVASADFETTDRLLYPLEQGFVLEYDDAPALRYDGNSSTNVTKVYVSYYPRWDHGFYTTSWWFVDPWYHWGWYYGSYPCRSGFYWSIGWNWGWWGWGACPYYYYPYYYGCRPYYACYGYYDCYRAYYPAPYYRYRSVRPSATRGARSTLHTAMNRTATRSTRTGYKSLTPRVASDRTQVASRRSTDLRGSYTSLRQGRYKSGDDVRVIRSKPLQSYKDGRSNGISSRRSRDIRSKTVSSRERRVITRSNRSTTFRSGKRDVNTGELRRTSERLGRDLGDTRSGRPSGVKPRSTGSKQSSSNRAYKPNVRSSSTQRSPAAKKRAPSTRSSPRSKASGSRGSSRSSGSRSGGKGRR